MAADENCSAECWVFLRFGCGSSGELQLDGFRLHIGWNDWTWLESDQLDIIQKLKENLIREERETERERVDRICLEDSYFLNWSIFVLFPLVGSLIHK